MIAPKKFDVVALAFIASMASAQQRMLTVEESIAIGMQNSKALHSSLMKSNYSDAKSSEIAAGFYPSVKFQAGYQKLSDIPSFTIPIPNAPVTFPVILNNYTVKASLQQPLFTGWKLQSAADNAEYTSNAAHSDYTKDKAEIVYSIKSAYWNVYRAKELKRLSDENVNQIGQHLADIENLFKQGMATTNAVLKVKVQLSNAKLLQSDASNNVEIAIIAFNSTVGIPLDTDVGIASSLTPTTKDFPEVHQLLVKAMSERPDMHAMDWRLRASEAGVTAAQSGWLPQVFLSGNYYYSRPNQRIFPAQDQFKDTWDVGVNLQFDIWNNLTTVYQTAQAQSQYDQTKDAYAMLKDGVTLEVTQNYLNVKQVKQKIQLAQLGVEQSDENLRVAQETFKAGLTTNSELLDAEVGQLQSKIQLLQSLVEYELAQAKLEKSVGAVGELGIKN
jgi:outer membrane protein TolC